LASDNKKEMERMGRTARVPAENVPVRVHWRDVRIRCGGTGVTGKRAGGGALE